MHYKACFLGYWLQFFVSSGIILLGGDCEVTIYMNCELEALASGAYDIRSYLKVSSQGFVCFYDILY
jgi:hypothetical protein